MIKINYTEHLAKELQEKYHLIFPCNQKGICGKCRVKVIEGSLNPTSLDYKYLKSEEIEEGIRLVCDKKKAESCVIETLFQSAEVKLSELIEKQYIPESHSVQADLCIDFGSTTIVFRCIHESDQTLICERKFLNPQVQFGSDIISRIAYSKDHFQNLFLVTQRFLREKVSEMVEDFKLHLKDIYISGNNVMNHILMNENICDFGTYPYLCRFKEEKTFELQVNHQNIFCHLFPSFSTFVGGDIVSGVYSITDQKKRHQNFILVDLGTNGEIVLKYKDHYYCTSTAIGPCFEGYNIECGMPYLDGAIYLCGEETLFLGEKPKGICGSGLISLIAYLLQKNEIDESGLLREERFYVTEEIYLSRRDVREFQLAKSAVFTGIQILLKEANCAPFEVDHLYLTGGLSSLKRVKDFFSVGLIPDNYRHKFIVLPNMSLDGAVKRAINDFEPESVIDEIIRNSSVISLNENENFQDLFVDNLAFKTEKE